MKPTNPVEAPVDIVIVTVTKVESLAVLEAFEKQTGQKAHPQPRGDKTYHELGVVNGARVWLVLSEKGAGGLGGAQQTVSKAIAELEPAAVVMVGIAFGVDEKKQAIGDILVSESLRLYDLQRVGTDDGQQKIILRGDRPHASAWLLDAFRNADLRWEGAKVRFGCLLTGDKLVDNLDFREQLRPFEPEAIGGEMEGAGLYTACQDAKVDWLLVKAICDWGDGHKHRNKKKRQTLAARNAARFVLHTLTTVGLNGPKHKGASSRRKAVTEPGALARVHGNGSSPLAFNPQALAPYLDHVAKASADVRLAGIDPKAGDPNNCQRLQLANVYVGLDTELRRKPTPGELAKLRTRSAEPEMAQMERAEQIPLSALEAAAAHRRLVLTGRPGSGKTTFVRYLCLCFTRHGLKPEEGWLAKLKPSGWPEEVIVPITVELRYFARSLPARLPATPSERETSPQPRDLWDFFVRTTLQPNKLEALEPMLVQAIADGRALVIFEGLDEVPSGPQRTHVHQAILRFAAASQFQASRVLVTCRSRAYEQTTLKLPGFTDAPLADFVEPKIRQFTEAWYAELARLDKKPAGEYAARAVRLYRAIRVPSLWAHAGRPMLLTVMANVHAKNDKLPKDRAQVYAEMVEILVESWDNVRLEELAPLRRLLEAARKDKKDLIRFLGELAFEAHQRDQGKGKGRDALADIPKLGTDGLLEKFKAFCGSYDYADSLIEAIDQRAGLLVSPDVGSGIYQFPHRSFQEYLAGMHLANEPDFVQRALDLVNESERRGASAGKATNHEDIGYWDEVLKWAAGVIAHVINSPRFWGDVPALASDLCGASGPETCQHKLALAAEILTEMGEDKLKDRKTRDGVHCLEHVQRLLLEWGQSSTLAAKERAPMGMLLGQLGDPRPGVGLKQGVPDIVFEELQFPAGEFALAENRRKVHIEQPYRLSRYPVTVAQFQAFVDAKGYEQDPLWLPKGRAWRDGNTELNDLPEWYRDEYRKLDFPIRGPQDYGPVFQTPNHPRVGASWYEATAFCRWLTKQLHSTFDIQHSALVCLPHEAEWEQAARWNVREQKVDGRYFPWGGTEDAPDLAQRCNMAKTEIGHTSAVGLFPSGAVDCGALDMSGNVWEWCENLYQENEPWRVLRGGSWFIDNPERLSCSSRGRDLPVRRFNRLGFRCVLVGMSSARG